MLLGVLAQLGHAQGVDQLDRSALRLALAFPEVVLKEVRLIGVDLAAIRRLDFLEVAACSI